MIKKVTLIIGILLLMILKMKNVSALNTSTLEYIKNVYYNIQIGNYYHSDYQAYLKVDGVIVYCIEPEILVGINKDYNEIPLFNTNITESQLKKIELIGHYGYSYINHFDYKYYLAAQEMIWEIIRPGIKMSWSSKMNGDESSYISVSKEKNDINHLIDNHYKKPYFSNTTLKSTINETIELTDDILEYYELATTDIHEVKLISNKLIIKTDEHYVGESTISLKRKNRDDNLQTKIYSLNNYQTLIYPRTTVEDIELKIMTETGTLTLKKIDSETLEEKGQGQASLKGTKYQILDINDNLINELEINENPVTTKPLKLGKYKIKEIQSGAGYILDSKIYEVELTNENLNQTIELKNEIIKGTLKIKKLYGYKDFYEEKNALFSITDIYGNTKEYETDENGEICVVLSYGEYIVKQIKGKLNHKLVDEFKIFIDEENKVYEYKLKNFEIKANLIINKIDFDTKEFITDPVGFKIYNIDKQEYIENGQIFYTVNGRVLIENLSLGKYQIEEVITPNKYAPINKIEIEISSDLEISIANKKIEQYEEISVPDTGITTIKMNKIFGILILSLGYLVVKYAKK